MGFGAALEKCQLAQELKIIYDRYIYDFQKSVFI